MRLLVEDLLGDGKPVCVIDDWLGIKLNRSGQVAGYPVIIFGGEHVDVPLTVHVGAPSWWPPAAETPICPCGSIRC
jgi:hypothetical protein